MQKAGSAHSTSKQILHFGYTEQYIGLSTVLVYISLTCSRIATACQRHASTFKIHMLVSHKKILKKRRHILYLHSHALLRMRMLLKIRSDKRACERELSRAYVTKQEPKSSFTY